MQMWRHRENGYKQTHSLTHALTHVHNMLSGSRAGITYQNERTRSMKNEIIYMVYRVPHAGRDIYTMCVCVRVQVPRNVLMSIHVIRLST